MFQQNKSETYCFSTRRIKYCFSMFTSLESFTFLSIKAFSFINFLQSCTTLALKQSLSTSEFQNTFKKLCWWYLDLNIKTTKEKEVLLITWVILCVNVMIKYQLSYRIDDVSQFNIYFANTNHHFLCNKLTNFTEKYIDMRIKGFVGIVAPVFDNWIKSTIWSTFREQFHVAANAVPNMWNKKR